MHNNYLCQNPKTVSERPLSALTTTFDCPPPPATTTPVLPAPCCLSSLPTTLFQIHVPQPTCSPPGLCISFLTNILSPPLTIFIFLSPTGVLGAAALAAVDSSRASVSLTVVG